MYTSSAAALLLALPLQASIVVQPPCEDRMLVDCGRMTDWPARLIGRTFTDFDRSDGCNIFAQNASPPIASGTAFLVSPFAALTSGHVVFERDGGVGFAQCLSFTPGQCTSGTGVPCGSEGDESSPFLSRESLFVDTNTSYMSAGTPFPYKYDYGAILFACPDPLIRTFMPLVFDYEPDNEAMRSKGYPGNKCTDSTPPTPIRLLPDPGHQGSMWEVFSTTAYEGGRVVKYRTTFGGGSSGSPIYGPGSSWQAYAVSSTRFFNAVSCDKSGGPRFTDKNRDLIRSWMEFVPTAKQQGAAGCPPTPPDVLSWGELRGLALQRPQDWLNDETANVTDVPPTAPTTPSDYQILQVIENGFYEFAVWHLDPADAGSPRFIQLLAAPGESRRQEWAPGMRWDPGSMGFLDSQEATILLSASVNRFGAPLTDLEPMFPQVPDLVTPLAMPEFPDDQNPDDPGQDQIDVSVLFDPPCSGDLNGDGQVDSADLGMLLGAWGGGGDPAADLNGDGGIDSSDLGLLLGFWGPCM